MQLQLTDGGLVVVYKDKLKLTNKKQILTSFSNTQGTWKQLFQNSIHTHTSIASHYCGRRLLQFHKNFAFWKTIKTDLCTRAPVVLKWSFHLRDYLLFSQVSDPTASDWLHTGWEDSPYTKGKSAPCNRHATHFREFLLDCSRGRGIQVESCNVLTRKLGSGGWGSYIV